MPATLAGRVRRPTGRLHRGPRARGESPRLPALHRWVSVRRATCRGPMSTWLLLDGWPSITKGLECVSWGLLLGLAMLFAATPARSLGRPVEWTLRVSGTFALAGLVGPATGNMNLYLLSTAGYSVGFLLLAIEVLVHFRVSRVGELPPPSAPLLALGAWPGGRSSTTRRPDAG